MGMYLNPGNEGFKEIRRSDYVDKSGLIAQINQTIGINRKLTCISRPRRFGKSFAAQMLCAYYDKSCDSHALFDDLEIAGDANYETHLNAYDVIYLDITGIKGEYGAEKCLDYAKDAIEKELSEAYPEAEKGSSFDQTLLRTVEHTGNKFVMIIDEWDVLIREEPQMAQTYLYFLRTLFKNSGTTAKIFAAAYMTGILPIKMDGSQSAVSDFLEYTMIEPHMFSKYVGFTENEVHSLCEKFNVDFDVVKQWYDGYSFEDVGSIYNPNSVMKAVLYKRFTSYWTQTSAATSLMEYISKDYNGLTKTVAELIGGMEVSVDTVGFANDLTTFRGRDDVLTLLIHLGYLAYDANREMARIPNEEIRMEFSRAIRNVSHAETLKRLEECDRLFENTIYGNEDAVAEQIEKIHSEETVPLLYNREDSLRSVIKLAYYTYRDHYLQLEELPAGDGCADIVYLPKKDSGYPALLIELKWNKSADNAIAQIHDRNYPQALEGFGGELLLVGINYDKDAPIGQRKHTCRIERVEK